MSRVLMFQGTASDAGKSTVVAGLGRALVRRGLRARPFKPQNMSNNAAVTPDGGEIGRAQALQARACRELPSVDMNPVLLKPEGETRAQLVLRGRRVGTALAADFAETRRDLLGLVMESYARVCEGVDVVLVEGAGSASETNLRAHDIANWRFAQAAQAPVVLVGDIDRGGVIASLVGTKHVLATEDAALVRGFVINKLRGEPRLFDEGVSAIIRQTGWPCHGVLPWVHACARLPAEDAVVLERASPASGAPATGDPGKAVHVVVLQLPTIANFDDVDPLAAEPNVRLSFLRAAQVLPVDADVVLLPGSKATRHDLAFLRAQGWDVDIAAHVRRGGHVLGLCGGYQMLGRAVHDPHGLEGPPGSAPGLGLLEVETLLAHDKRLEEVTGRHAASGLPFRGYEIHVGHTTGEDTQRPWAFLDGDDVRSSRPDGARAPHGRVAGTYVHGFFAADELRHRLLREWSDDRGPSFDRAGGVRYEELVEESLEQLADAIERHLDVDALLATAA